MDSMIKKIEVNRREKTKLGRGKYKNHDRQEKNKLLKMQYLPSKNTPCSTYVVWGRSVLIGRYSCQSYDLSATNLNVYELET